MTYAPPFSVEQFILGLTLAVVAAVLAYRVHFLNRSGALAAALLGTLVFGLGGSAWAVLLLAFFLTSSGLSRAFKRHKAGLNEKFSKGSRRDAWQVAANGGVSGLFVLLHVLFPSETWAWLGFAGSLAAANADTWATELGVLSRSQPILISTGRRVEAGTSGGISPAGTLAALTGSALIGLLGAWLWNLAVPASGSATAGLFFARAGGITLAGLLGSLIDSYLGATIQTIYTCPACQKETERHPTHLCGTPTVFKRGLRWLDNDWVNILCTLSGGILAGLFALTLAAPQISTANQFFLEGTPMPEFILTSTAFQPGGAIPARHTCDDENKSPQLLWSAPPADTRSFALIVDDPDAPAGTFTHWVLYDIPATLTGLPDNVPPSPNPKGIGTQGKNNFRHNWYDGPCPPRGKPHHYFFRLYALDAVLGLPAGQSAQQLQQAMHGHILAQAQLIGIYQR